MNPIKIDTVESTFATNLKDSNGVTHSLINKIDIGNECFIKQIRPNFNSYYYQTETKKTAICLHFTVGNIKGDIGSLTKKDNKVSVQYVVDRQGNIYNLFDDKYWSYHLGANCVGTNGTMSKQTIGIEISNYGPLKLSGSNLLDAYGNTYCAKVENQYYKECNYREYKYYATMTDKQEMSVARLLIYLCKQHNIPKVFKFNADQIFESNKAAQEFKGIFLHTSVRKDKFDWPLEMLNGVQDKMVEKPYTQVCKDPAFDLKFNGVPNFTGIFK